jgi:hypothetical protein
MIWLAWRQQRFAFIAAAALVAVYGGLAVAAHYDAEFATITQLFAGYVTIGVCMFWGAPLVARDLEYGTHRLVWTQSRPRSHWLAARLAVAAVGALAAAAAVTAIVSLALPTAAVDPAHWFYYESHDLIPLARVLFGLALGAALGALTRHTHIAMAISAPILGFVQLGGVRSLRENVNLSYWQLQATEAASYLAIAAILAAATFLAVRRLP